MNQHKILSLVMLSTLSLSTFSPVLANEYTSDGQGSMTITKEVASSYTVLIPQTVTLNDETTTFTVSAKGNIAPDKKVVVASDADIVMSRANDTAYLDQKATVAFADGTWEEKDLISTYTDKSGNITFNETKAGTYTGTLNFDISLANK